MSRELINRITIKKDGVYLSTHSSNDTAPYHSHKIDFLTKSYILGGQKELDKEIMKLLLNYGDLRGNHESIIPYKRALNDYLDLRIKTSLGKIRSLEDLVWGYDLNLKQNIEYSSEVGKTKDELIADLEKEKDKLYTELAEKVQDYRVKLNKKDETYIATAIMIKNDENPFTVNVVRGTKDIVEESLKHFQNTYKNTDIKIVNINIRKEGEKDISKDIVEKYNNKLDYGLKNTPNGNYIFTLKNVITDEKEQEIFIQILKSDNRLSDLEMYEEDGEGLVVDLVAYLDFCPNIDKGEEDEL